jgi:hypothetical protein
MQYIMGHFKEYLDGGKTFLTLNCSGQKSRELFDKSLEMPHYVFCPKQTKNNISGGGTIIS